MSMERTMNPAAAQAHMKRIVRSRYRALRLGHRVDSPAIVADRLVTYLSATADAYPVDPSPAYRAYVEQRFSEAFFDLCKTTPVRWRA